MASYNTEKPVSKEMKKKNQTVQDTNIAKKQVQQQSQKKAPVKDNQENNQEVKKTQQEKTSEKTQEKEQEKTTKKQQNKKPKKTEAKVDVKDIPISTKVSAAICKFIKNKEIRKAVNDLDRVINKKMAVPMKGEYPHRKGIMSGKYPIKAAKEFKRLLRSLGANAVENGLEKPIIKTAIANIGQRPMAKFGRWQRKRTHIMIIVKESFESDKKNKKQKNKQKSKIKE